MLSIPDMALLGAAALLLFGPDQLPRVVRKVGQFTREVQNTSQSFIREMERAADMQDVHPTAPALTHDLPPLESYDPFPYEAPEAVWTAPDPPVGEKLAEPRPAAEHDGHAAFSDEAPAGEPHPDVRGPEAR
jgi:sec-independent protein translocase protein TatA